MSEQQARLSSPASSKPRPFCIGLTRQSPGIRMLPGGSVRASPASPTCGWPEEVTTQKVDREKHACFGSRVPILHSVFRTSWLDDSDHLQRSKVLGFVSESPDTLSSARVTLRTPRTANAFSPGALTYVLIYHLTSWSRAPLSRRPSSAEIL